MIYCWNLFCDGVKWWIKWLDVLYSSLIIVVVVKRHIVTWWG